MTRLHAPLRGRVVLVLGAGDRAGQAAALRLSAVGAAIVAAGPSLDAVVVTAGLVAASGGTVRVVEKVAPPLPILEVVRLAGEALEPPTDAVVSAASFGSKEQAYEAAHEISRLLAPGANVTVIDAVPAGQEKAAAERLAARFISENGVSESSTANGSQASAER